MKDEEILRLYRERSETALTETERQYGALCGTIARNILRNRQDAEECVNDTWHRAWNSIPPEEPRSLAAYLGRITRNLALNRLEKQNRMKCRSLFWKKSRKRKPLDLMTFLHWSRRRKMVRRMICRHYWRGCLRMICRSSLRKAARKI